MRKATLIAIAVLVLVALTLVTCEQPPDDPPFGGVTNLDSLTLSDDLIVGDDITLGDDFALGDDLTISGDLKVGDGTPTTTLNGEDAYIEGTFEVDGAINLDGAVDMDSTLDVAGNVSDGGGTFTIADDVLIDGAADAAQLTVQGYTTQTNYLFIAEQSGGTDKFTIDNSGNIVVQGTAQLNGSLSDTNSTFTIADDVTIDGAADAVQLTVQGNGTQTNNTFVVEQSDGTDKFSVSDAGVLTVMTDTEHIGLPSIDAVAILTTTDGALWTAGATEIWFIHTVYCHVTTDFVCDGDDCILHIGDGNDADGFLDLDDGELQAADTEGTGALAGWQGFMSTDTRGAYLANGHGFVYGNDTIDILLEDNSGHTDPTDGAATCYIVYTRIQ